MLRLGPTIPFALLAALSAVFAANLAAAQSSSPVDLRWGAPPSCPSGEEVERDIVRTIGGRAVGQDHVQARVDVWESEAGGWKADIELSARGQATRRQVHGDTCRAVASAVAIVVGVAAIQDSAPAVDGPPAPIPGSETTTSPEVPVPPPASIPPKAPSPTPLPGLTAAPATTALHATGPAPPLHLLLGASALVDIGSLPQPAPGVEIFSGWKEAWWRLEIAAAYLLPQSAYAQAPGHQGASFWLAELGGRACAAWGRGGFEGGPCAGAGVARMQASGIAEYQPGSTAGYTARVSLGARAVLPLARWAAVHFAADLVAPFHRPTFFIQGFDGTVYEPYVYQPFYIAFRGGLGLDARF